MEMEMDRWTVYLSIYPSIHPTIYLSWCGSRGFPACPSRTDRTAPQPRKTDIIDSYEGPSIAALCIYSLRIV